MIIDFDFFDDWDDLDNGTVAIDEQELTGFDDSDEADLADLPMEGDERALDWPPPHDITQDSENLEGASEVSMLHSKLSSRSQFAQLRFCGGCDCGYSPLTCCAGHACRWQY
ncbi:MAG: hypothetical protein DYG89_43625 [Caldilinea sp. CFX5]|nr:hypothetical protein [Caldilinea sp. CFX5]